MAMSLEEIIAHSPPGVLAVVRGSDSDFKTSGVLSGDTLIRTGKGFVSWVSVSDSAALSIELNDSTANDGTDQWGIDLPADAYGMWIFDPPIPFVSGIYLDVSTVTCKVVVGYKEAV